MDYTKSTNFASKDSLSPGSALKIVRGTEIDTEFNNIATAVATKANSSDVTSSLATKADLASPALTGNPTAPTPSAGDNDTSIATTAFVTTAVAALGYPAFKNRIINGAMMIDQRNAGASITQAVQIDFPVDRFSIFGSVTSKFTAQQNAGSLSAANRPTGFTNYLGITSSSAYTVGASELFVVRELIEGFNVADFGWGTANASTATLSFWIRSSLTGTFGGAFRNSDGSRSYPFSYTVSSANTWEQKTITVAGDTAGTWLTTNGVGLQVVWGLGCGSSVSGTAGTWSGSSFFSATGATSVVGTNGATFYITGVQLEKGSTATSFDYRPYGTELALCQRYFYRRSGAEYYSACYWQNTTDWNGCVLQYPVTMRAAPAFTFAAASNFTIGVGNGSATAATISAATISANSADIYGTVSSGGTSFAGGVLAGGASASISISAEL